jgi:hypothetical protein
MAIGYAADGQEAPFSQDLRSLADPGASHYPLAGIFNGFRRHQAPIITRHYQALACRISPDEQSRMAGADAMRRRCDPTCREFTRNDGVNRARIHAAAAPYRARVGGLSARLYHR